MNCAACSPYPPLRKEALDHAGRKAEAEKKEAGKPVGEIAEADGRKVERAGKAAKATVKGHHASDERRLDPAGHRKDPWAIFCP